MFSKKKISSAGLTRSSCCSSFPGHPRSRQSPQNYRACSNHCPKQDITWISARGWPRASPAAFFPRRKGDGEDLSRSRNTGGFGPPVAINISPNMNTREEKGLIFPISPPPAGWKRTRCITTAKTSSWARGTPSARAPSARGREAASTQPCWWPRGVQVLICSCRVPEDVPQALRLDSHFSVAGELQQHPWKRMLGIEKASLERMLGGWDAGGKAVGRCLAWEASPPPHLSPKPETRAGTSSL